MKSTFLTIPRIPTFRVGSIFDKVFQVLSLTMEGHRDTYQTIEMTSKPI